MTFLDAYNKQFLNLLMINKTKEFSSFSSCQKFHVCNSSYNTLVEYAREITHVGWSAPFNLRSCPRELVAGILRAPPIGRRRFRGFDESRRATWSRLQSSNLRRVSWWQRVAAFVCVSLEVSSLTPSSTCR